MTSNKFSIAIHGGAGTILKSHMTEALEKKYSDGLQDALDSGYTVLEKHGTAVDAVEAAVLSLENNPLFNAGKGSVFSATGSHDMDASIMNGADLQAGAVSGITNVKNPIRLARAIMDQSDHAYLSGDGAMDFAKKVKMDFMDKEYFHDEFRYQQWLDIKDTGKVQLDHSLSGDEKFGTVGAVAKDEFGHIAAATSTGGMTNKQFGRVGDSCIIGAGTYANDLTCGISCTGDGEYFIRGVVAYDVSCLMEYKGLNLQEACDIVIKDRLIKIGGSGGLIAVDQNGSTVFSFNTEGMYRARKSDLEESEISIYAN